MSNDDALQRTFAELGLAACNHAAPLDLAAEIRAMFESADYDKTEQTRRHHYSHVQRMDGTLLPTPDETYIARFSRAVRLEKNDRIRFLVDQHLLPLAARVAGGWPGTDYELRAYRMDAGDLLRLHVDDYVAGLGFIYYLSKEWRWDWGGILTAIRDGQAYSLAPVYNQLTVVNHGLRLPHFVSQITDYAREPRYMLVGLIH